MSAFTAYFDGSGTQHDQPVLAVAGFVSLTQRWLDFEPVWNERLSKDGLECLHTREINRKFKGNSAGRQRLLEDLATIVESYVDRKFGCCVVNEAVGTISELDRRRWHINAYSLAGRSCAAQVRIWAKSWGARSLPRLVFEDGDRGRGELIQILERDGFRIPSFEPKKNRIRDGILSKGSVPLQAADLFADAVFEPSRKIENEGYIKHMPWLHDAFRKIPGEARFLGVNGIRDLRQRLENHGSELLE